MPTPHKHAELIKKWADDPNLIIQWKSPSDSAWQEGERLSNYKSWYCWDEDYNYRIKPKLVKREGWTLLSRIPSTDGRRQASAVCFDKEKIDLLHEKWGNGYLVVKVEWEEEV